MLFLTHPQILLCAGEGDSKPWASFIVWATALNTVASSFKDSYDGESKSNLRSQIFQQTNPGTN